MSSGSWGFCEVRNAYFADLDGRGELGFRAEDRLLVVLQSRVAVKTTRLQVLLGPGQDGEKRSLGQGAKERLFPQTGASQLRRTEATQEAGHGARRRQCRSAAGGNRLQPTPHIGRNRRDFP